MNTRHEVRKLLRLLIRVMREHKVHRRMRHAIQRTLEKSYGP
jgi:hypothetical protein